MPHTRKSGGWRLIACLLTLACSLARGPAGVTPTVPIFTAAPPAASPTAPDQGEAATPAPAGSFTAEALSAARVALAWEPAAEATGYHLDARYGAGEAFPVADLPAAQTSFTHFVAPGSAGLTYTLSAVTVAGAQPVAEAAVTLPALEAAPLLVDAQLAAGVAGSATPPPLPTIDPLNPDLDALATLAAYAENLNPDLLAPTDLLVMAEAEVGPEGGALSLTTPEGLVYTLTVPAGALTAPTVLTLLGLGEISNFPFSGGPVGAVQLHPPIPFRAPLRLTIAAPAAPQGQALVGFTIASDSHELALTPLYPAAGGGYELDVYWGDSFGLAAATPAEVAAQADQIPSDPAAQLDQQLAALRAFNPDPSPAGELRLAAQLMAGLLEQLAALPAPAAARAAGLAAPQPQLTSGANLWYQIAMFDRILSNERQTPIEIDDPGFPRQLNSAQRAQVIDQLVSQIKAFLDAHQGCRHRDDFYAQALVQLLKNPGSSFQRLLSLGYTTRFGPPADLAECQFQLHIVKSTIVQTAQDELGELIETVVVHANPFPLLAVGRGPQTALRGVGPVTYEAYTDLFTDCPPAIDVQPFPSPTIWITDLRPVFDADGLLVNFALKGVTADPLGGDNKGTVTTESENGICRVIGFESAGEPDDAWGRQFPAFHNPRFNSDHWVIVGQDSYVATSDPGEAQGAGQTETTTMVLTVNRVN